MLFKKYFQNSSNLFAENRLLKFCVIVLTCGFLWFAHQVNEFKDKARTVIVPPNISSKIVISGSWTSDSYANEYMRYVGSLLWNYSPATVREQFSELLASFHPSTFQAAKERLYIFADQVEQTRASSVFYINKIVHNPEKKFIEVTGTRHLSLQDKTVESTVKTYMVLYKIENGRFWLLGVEEKDDKAKRPIGASVPNVAAVQQGVTGEH